QEAKVIEEQFKGGAALHFLAGIPIAIKDNICVEGELTTCASRILYNFISPYNATAVKRLKEAGAIIIGKTNLDEFAMGSSSETSYFGAVKNPLNPDYVPGGSSGGSAAVVAYGGSIGALGSDTGGSIRQPASFCGVVGLKPTYGRVSRYGLVAFASSLDCIGPITRNVCDAALIFSVIAGYDPYDATTVNLPVDLLVPDKNKITEYTIGIPKEYIELESEIDNEVKKIFDETINELKKIVRSVKIISLPLFQYHLACYYLICTAEASSNLARYDGVRYGLREKCESLIEMYEKTRDIGFGREVKRRILLGTYALSKGYYEEYYGTAQKVRNLIKKDFAEAFKQCDIIITPTSPTLPFKLNERITNPLAMYRSDLFTTGVSLAGIPAISVPAPSTSNGFSVGIQIIGRPFCEKEILNCALAIEELRK
ncbi:MAG: Asp-tRNA(Asn)/Glu-tRNA(Gln) amidotransferase subunit GatA, partial [candidate division WOR-3 bacterium]|nr:Asp-tRNA(Asn)/Glu-tRNA(Gln) amidotransferase subunit GatA [candidate division WOR-3 bacterium]